MNYINYLSSIISNGGYLLGFFIIILESFIPILPLNFFVALNVNSFGLIIGFIISWLATCIGSIISFFFFRLLFNNFFITSNCNLFNYYKKLSIKLSNISFSNLVLIIALPFSPSFLINILCAFSKIKYFKFILSILIGKMFMVIFWSIIGDSFINSIKDIRVIVFISFLLVLAYIISKYIGSKFELN